MKPRRILREHPKSNPMTTTALLTMGVIRFYQGRVPEAIEYAQATIRSEPDASKAHDLLGMGLKRSRTATTPRSMKCAAP